jgi:hypothetical protein
MVLTIICSAPGLPLSKASGLSATVNGAQCAPFTTRLIAWDLGKIAVSQKDYGLAVRYFSKALEAGEYARFMRTGPTLMSR